MRRSDYDSNPWTRDRRIEGRNIAEMLRVRTVLLAEKERALMRMYLESGQSIRRIACLAGTSPTTTSRRIRRIAGRLMDNTYLTCVARRSEFDTFELAVIRDHFVRGLSMVAISEKYDITYYRIRAIVHKARRHTRDANDRPASRGGRP